MSTQLEPKMTDLITYSVTDAALAEMHSKYIGLRVLSVDDEEGYAQCKEARGIVRSTRLSVEERRKELKSESLAFGRAVDAEASRIVGKITAVEQHLVSQLAIVDDEKKRREEEAKKQAIARFNKRIEQLQAFNATFSLDDVAKMEDEAFDDFLSLAETRFNADKRKREEEQARLAELEKERAANDALLAAEREKTRQLEAEAQKMRDETLEREREEGRKAAEALRIATATREAAEAALVAERAAAKAQADKEESARREAQRAAEAEAAKQVADKKLFAAVKKSFPTLESAWVEIARLHKLLGTTPPVDALANGGVHQAI